jgi:hypothetical protein
MKLLFIFFILISVNLFGQDNPRTKTRNDVLGKWKFKPFSVLMDNGEKAIMDEWIVMKITFSEQGNFKFVLSDSSIQEGKWAISDNGKTLWLTERRQAPKRNEELMPLNLPIKAKRGKYVKLTTKLNGKEEKIKFVPMSKSKVIVAR